MNENARLSRDGAENPSRLPETARDERDAAAGRVLDWLEGPHKALSPSPFPEEAIKLLAEHAQRESSLDRLVDAIDTARQTGDLTKPLVDIHDAQTIAENAEACRSIEAREAGRTIRLLSAELIAADRRLARLITPEDVERAACDLLKAGAVVSYRDVVKSVLASLGFQAVDVEACDACGQPDAAHEMGMCPRNREVDRAVGKAIEQAIEDGALSVFGGPAGGSMADADDLAGHEMTEALAGRRGSGLCNASFFHLSGRTVVTVFSEPGVPDSVEVNGAKFVPAQVEESRS